jgi:hypothetical protein
MRSSAVLIAGIVPAVAEPEAINVGRYVAFRDPFGNVHELIELKR